MQSAEGKMLAVASISKLPGRRLRMIKEVDVHADGSPTRRWGTRADDVRVPGRITVVLVDEVLGF